MRELIDRGANASEIFEFARGEGMRLMLEDGIEKARMGITSLEEVRKLHATIDIKLPVEGASNYRLSA